MKRKILISLGASSLLLASAIMLSLNATKSSAKSTTASDIVNNTTIKNSIYIKDVYSLLADKSINFIYNTSLDQSTNIQTDSALVLNNVAIPLYPTFTDSHKALDDIKLSCSNYLNVLSKKYNLSELSVANWQYYYDAAFEYLDDEENNNYYTETSSEFIALIKFFDIYENELSNYIIKNKIDNINSTSEILTNETLINELPSTAISYLQKEYNLKKAPMFRMPFNVEKASAYARKHALNPNKKVYETCKFDCTNFVSQIAFEGGKQITEEWKAYRKSLMTGAFSKYTFAWCNANGFVNYYGPSSVYDNFSDFTENAKEGNVIAYDMTNDNDWDHVGYVLSKGEYSPSLGYTDLEIAQHSRDYLAWISDDNNGWDTLQNSYKDVVYALVQF